MTVLEKAEFKEMENMLGGLLTDANTREELLILQMHQRLQSLYVDQSKLREARDYLLTLIE